MVNVNKKYVKIAVRGLALSALVMGISVGLTTKNKNNSNVSLSNAVKKYFDFDENAMEKRLTEQAVGSAANVGKSGGTTRMLIVPETEEYAAHVTSGMGRQLRNDLTRRLNSKTPKSSKVPIAKTSKTPKSSKVPIAKTSKTPKSSKVPIAKTSKTPKSSKVPKTSKTPKSSKVPIAKTSKMPKSSKVPIAKTSKTPKSSKVPKTSKTPKSSKVPIAKTSEPEFTCSYDKEEKEAFPVCPGMNDNDYCDGTSDCDDEFCSCAAGQQFCIKEDNPCRFTCSYDEEEKEAFPVCPGMNDNNYCDGTSDCDDEFCSCAAGQQFCIKEDNPCGGPKPEIFL